MLPAFARALDLGTSYRHFLFNETRRPSFVDEGDSTRSELNAMARSVRRFCGACKTIHLRIGCQLSTQFEYRTETNGNHPLQLMERGYKAGFLWSTILVVYFINEILGQFVFLVDRNDAVSYNNFSAPTLRRLLYDSDSITLFDTKPTSNKDLFMDWLINIPTLILITQRSESHSLCSANLNNFLTWMIWRMPPL